MRLVGATIPRVEDHRILTGGGRYVEDIQLRGLLHAAFVRSPLAHGRISRIDCDEARSAPGVVAIFTGEDMTALTTAIPVPAAGPKVPRFHALATDKVRFVGDPVAIVVAVDRYLAEDAAELVDVRYEPLPPVVDAFAALDPSSPRLFDDLDDNVLGSDSISIGDVEEVFASAELIVAVTLRQHRVSPAPMEGRASIAEYDPASRELTVHTNCQHPHGLRLALADVLLIPLENVRVVTVDIGGAFGLKGSFSREEFCLAATARALARPVKWVEDRVEHLLAAGHARDETVDIEVAVTRDGKLLAMRANMTLDQGAYPKAPFPASVVTSGVRDLLPGPYQWQAYSYSSHVMATNKCTYVSYRGPWAVETWARERALDEVARAIGMDPAELRRRNVIAGHPGDRSITGRSLDGISTEASLARALELIDYEGFRRSQAVAPSRSARRVGVGVATFIEAVPGPVEWRAGGGPFGGEQAKAKLETNGHLVIITSQTPGGQGLETTLAQVAADELGVPFEHVKVLHGDTRLTPFKLIGTGGSMSSSWASGAVRIATRRLKEKVLALAAHLMETDSADLEIKDGNVMPKGVPARTLPLAQLARQAILAPFTLPPDVDRVLETHENFVGDGITGSGWSGGTHACTVEVDLESGQVKILRYVVVEDCGRVINPAIVEGQVCGAVAQAVGEVFLERAVYDDGNFLAATFMDYLLPTAAEVPSIEIDHLETDPDGEFGSRGVGEGGLIVGPAALTNAVADALAPCGVRILEQYLPPDRVLELAGVIPMSDARIEGRQP